MERESVAVKSGVEYDHLFPKAMLTSITKKKGATVKDTIRFIPTVVRDTLFHTGKIAKVLERKTLHETCRAIWHFVYDHIAYKKDEDGKEQVRSPARAWHDRGNIQGVDCDCYTVFISSILSNLNIRHILRITKYKKDHFQHIYPIVPLADGSYITIDCVVNHFDYEEPYTEKQDTNMDLEYLNGVNDPSTDFDLVGIYDDEEAMAELGKIFKKAASPPAKPAAKILNVIKKVAAPLAIPKKIVSAVKTAVNKNAPVSTSKPEEKKGLFKGKIKEAVKKTLHVVNRINPATVLLRAGVLASMKLNVFKVPQRIKWAYLNEADAQKKGIDMAKFAQLKKVKEKLENIFFGAGGKPENLKEAILTGKGNKNKEVVAGLGYTPDLMDGMDEYTPLSSLLGIDMYQSEMAEAMQGLGDIGELGEPATAATIAAASGVLGAIAALLKNIGNIFSKKGQGSEDFENTETEGSTPVITTNEGTENPAPMAREAAPAEAPSEGAASYDPGASESESSEPAPAFKTSSANTPAPAANYAPSANRDAAPKAGEGKIAGFWENNKKWIKPVGIGIGTLGLLYAGYRIVSKPKPQQKQAVSGIPKSKKAKKKGGKKVRIKSKKQKKQAVALL